MWRRRATYDPMKAAAEGRKKQEEAKKSVQSSSKLNDRYVHNHKLEINQTDEKSHLSHFLYNHENLNNSNLNHMKSKYLN